MAYTSKIASFAVAEMSPFVSDPPKTSSADQRVAVDENRARCRSPRRRPLRPTPSCGRRRLSARQIPIEARRALFLGGGAAVAVRAANPCRTWSPGRAAVAENVGVTQSLHVRPILLDPCAYLIGSVNGPVAGDDDIGGVCRGLEQPQRDEVVLDRINRVIQVEQRNQDVRKHVAGDGDPTFLDEQRRVARGMGLCSTIRTSGPSQGTCVVPAGRPVTRPRQIQRHPFDDVRRYRPGDAGLRTPDSRPSSTFTPAAPPSGSAAPPAPPGTAPQPPRSPARSPGRRAARRPERRTARP